MNNAALESDIHEHVPEWLTGILSKGYRPYIATSERLLSSLNITPFGLPTDIYLLDDAEQLPFHESYLLSNSLSFSAPDLKMPHWVVIDCALMQSAIVGFTKPVSDIPKNLLTHYENDPRIELKHLEQIPVSGQIASPSTEPGNFVGISLFSLGQQLSGERGLGLYTKALALEVYRAREGGTFRGISQYDNPALKIHGRFSSRMEIEQPMVPLHPKREMTLVYKMAIEYDPYTIDAPPVMVEPTFWLNARDSVAKRRMQLGLREGKTYRIAPPFMETRQGEIFLPIIEGEKI